MNETLFPAQEKIRTLGWHQPFGSLMLHGKIETRIVQPGRKAPFPLGRYLIYTTKAGTDFAELVEICGPDTAQRILEILEHEPTAKLNGHAIATADLVAVRPMAKEDEARCFVPLHPLRWCLVFENVTRIEPFPWHFGKQGIGFVPDSELVKIKPARLAR